MNRRALDLGLYNTRFINPNGLPGSGQYITAYDLAEIMREAIKQPLLKEILGTRVAEVTTEEGKTTFIKIRTSFSGQTRSSLRARQDIHVRPDTVLSVQGTVRLTQ